MIALIMAGGSGTRFWPLSRRSHPKQYLNITSDRSMIQMTADRLLEKIPIEKIYVVTSADQAPIVQEHLPDMPAGNIIIEPFGRNTAPCIALSAQYLKNFCDADEEMFVLPADHVITQVDEFNRYLSYASEFTAKESHVTFGIKPTYPATGYGYIEASENLNEHAMKVSQFKEKPDLATAEGFIEQGNYFWNSGMFVWKISTILDSFKNYLPKVSELLDEIQKLWDKDGYSAEISSFYDSMPKIPIDIGIMEQVDNRVVIPVDYDWSDVGGWKALYEISDKDDNLNVLKCDATVIDSKSNYVKSTKHVALIGVQNLVVVETPDAILISDIDKSEEVKAVVNTLKETNEKLI